MKTCTPHSVGAEAQRLAARSASFPGRSLDSSLFRAVRSSALAAAAVGIAAAQVGTNYCTPVANSTGVAAAISGSGSASVVLNNLVLASTGLPQSSAAYFLCSRTPGFVQNPGGSTGNLCLGSPIGRVVGGVITSSGTTGAVSVAADVHAMPQPSGAVVVLPGETWNFQCWYRDSVTGGGSTSNFSDGLEVLFAGGGGNPIPGMVPIPPGTFLMGSRLSTSGLPYLNEPNTQPVHQVTISYPFWMARYEVTQSEYEALIGPHPFAFPGATRPVERVTWDQARAYCTVLTAGQAANLPVGYEYRLPTEAEWEYACRAGTLTEFHTGAGLLCSQARIWASYHGTPLCGVAPNGGTLPVGSYPPNAFGLHDMHGNVMEWCLDTYSRYAAAPVTNPFFTGGPLYVLRGGGWRRNSPDCRSAKRFKGDLHTQTNDAGLRVVLAPILVP